MKTLKLKLLIAILLVGIAFTGCNDDNDDGYISGPEDITIAIDATQAFNMKNFVASFEQSFVSRERWAWNFSHEYANGKAIETYQHLKIHGKFGENIFTITHSYNNEGVIISSERSSNPEFEGDMVVFTYKYDLNGFIVELTKTSDGNISVVDFTYNDKMQLISKYQEGNNYNKEEVFTYGSNGEVLSYSVSYTNSNSNSLYEFTYLNGKMIKEKEYYNETYNNDVNYEYDNQGRLVKSIWVEPDGSNEETSSFIYGEDFMSESQIENNLLYNIYDYGLKMLEIKSWNFDYNNGLFEYCRTKEYAYNYNLQDVRYVTKKEFFNGSPDNLVLVGYSIIDSREATFNKKTKESIYNAAGTKLYYAEFVVDSYGTITATNWFDAAGNAYQTNDFSEEEQSWIFVLVQ